jgi:hypothetical protein
MVLLALIILTGAACAAELKDGVDLDGLEQAAEGYLDGVSPDESLDLNGGLREIWDKAGTALGEVRNKSGEKRRNAAGDRPAVRGGRGQPTRGPSLERCSGSNGGGAGDYRGVRGRYEHAGGLGREAINNMTFFPKPCCPPWPP